MTRMTVRMAMVLFLAIGILGGAGCGTRGNQYGELTRLADKYQTDKGTKLHHYTEVYEGFFLPIRSSATKICEIGILEGASLRMFAEYFPGAVIYGIDIEEASRLETDRIKTFVADQSNREQLAAFAERAGNDFDIVLDDGGHTMEQQQVSLASLFPQVRSGGYYIIEDVHTSLRDGYGVDPGAENSTLTMILRYMRSGAIASRYMTKEEQGYLSTHISFCNLASRNSGNSIACIFKKL